MQTEVLRAFRFTLDPTKAQLADLGRHAGAARWAYNHALAAKVAAHDAWKEQVAALVGSGTPQTEARKKVRVPIPTQPTTQKAFNAAKGDSRSGADGLCPWWHEVSTYAFQSAFRDADTAWANWLASLKGARTGRPMGYPKFKKKGRCRDSFRLYHDASRPTPSIRLDGYRRLRLPRIGSVRMHDSGKRMARLIARGEAVVQSVTVARGGHRWYASVLCKVVQEIPDRPTRRQRQRGTVGVDIGVQHLAALSQTLTADDPASDLVANPRHLHHAQARLAKAQRAHARTRPGSARREKAKRRIGRLHHQVAVRRATTLHQLTKRLVTGFAVVAVEDLDIAGTTRSKPARGTADRPGGGGRRRHAEFNRDLLDVAPGEFRRQLAYKTSWYGSTLAVLDRGWLSSETCSACGWQNPRLTPADQVFHCDNCRTGMPRGLNSARNIARHAVPAPLVGAVASGTGETQNARGASVRPPAPRGGRQKATKREGIGPRGPVPPRRSDPPALPLRT